MGLSRRDFIKAAGGAAVGIAAKEMLFPGSAQAEGISLSSHEKLTSPEWNLDGNWFYDGFRVQIGDKQIRDGQFAVEFNGAPYSIPIDTARGALLDCFAGPDKRLYITRVTDEGEGMALNGTASLLFIDSQRREHLAVAGPAIEVGAGWGPHPDGILASFHRSFGFYKGHDDITVVASINASTEGGSNTVIGISRGLGVNRVDEVKPIVEIKLFPDKKERFYISYLKKMGVSEEYYNRYVNNVKDLTKRRLPTLEAEIKRDFNIDVVPQDVFYYAPVLPRELRNTPEGAELQLYVYRNLWGKAHRQSPSEETVNFGTLTFGGTPTVAHWK